MKVVKANADRMIMFSKREAGILKKMNGLIKMFDVEAAFLLFFEGGNPYTFSHLSMEELCESFSSRRRSCGKDLFFFFHVCREMLFWCLIARVWRWVVVRHGD